MADGASRSNNCSKLVFKSCMWLHINNLLSSFTSECSILLVLSHCSCYSLKNKRYYQNTLCSHTMRIPGIWKYGTDFHSYLKSSVPAPSSPTLKTHIHQLILKISIPGHRSRFVIRNKYTKPLPLPQTFIRHTCIPEALRRVKHGPNWFVYSNFYLLSNHLIS